MPLILPGIVISYILGSIPTAYIFGRLLKGIDIRQFGSGNVGATNALRILGRGPGITVLALDMLKGFISVAWLPDLLVFQAAVMPSEALRMALGIGCICGHTYTVFLRFKGGKGVATTFGVLLGLAVRVAGLNIVVGLVILTWLVVFIPSRIVALASIISVISMPVYMVLFKQTPTLIASGLLLALFIIWRHKANIKRILRGIEPRLSFKKR